MELWTNRAIEDNGIGFWTMALKAEGNRLEGDAAFWAGLQRESGDPVANYQSWYESIEKESENAVLDAVRQMIESGDFVTVNYLCTMSDQTERVFRLVGKLQEIQMDGTVLLKGYQQNVTETVVMRGEKERVRAQQRFWENLVETATFGVIQCECTEEKTEVTYINKAGRDILGDEDYAWLEKAIKDGDSKVEQGGGCLKVGIKLILEDGKRKLYNCVFTRMAEREIIKTVYRVDEETVGKLIDQNKKLLQQIQGLTEQNAVLLNRNTALLEQNASLLSSVSGLVVSEKERRDAFDPALWEQVQTACKEAEYDLAEETLKELAQYAYPERESEVLYRMLQACADFSYENLEELLNDFLTKHDE